MYKLVILINAILVMGSSYVVAQAQSATIDPAVASPTMNTVLLENEYVRVIVYQINPGEKDDWHTHPAKVSYVISGGSLRITTKEGASFIVEEEANSASWFGTVGEHYGENVGKTPVRIVFVEIKGIDAGKENLEKYQAVGKQDE